MNIEFKPLTALSLPEITAYSALRPIYTSEGQFMNQFIWAGFYDTKYYVSEKYLFFLMKINGEYATMMPYCKVEDIETAFFEMQAYFLEELKQPMKMYIVDQLFLDTISKSERFLQEYDVIPYRDSYDYIYTADKLRTLSGRALHKKKNHLNSFLKEFAGRYDYRTLCCSDVQEIEQFHMRWLEDRDVTDRINTISSEEDGVYRIFQNCSILDCRMGGIYIDGKLEAYSIGSYTPHLKTAFIHVEKANIHMKGLYNFINQQFLLNEFPDAELVNREDDLGQEGLRKSKLSYQPLRLEEKFNLFPKQ